jgi:uncharacterized protein YndB with AHSA1/START domain
VADGRSSGAAAVEPFSISRTYDAPRSLVWQAFSDPERMKHWWGPKGSTVVAFTMDFRPGGTYHYCLRSSDGSTLWGKFFYREIAAPERIVLVSCFADEAGSITNHAMAPTWPREMLSTFLFEERDGKTTVTIKWIPLNATAEEITTFESMRDSVRMGWTGTFDKLASYLAEA